MPARLVGFLLFRARRARPRGGQSTVELALLLPVFLLVLVGVVDLGRAFYRYAVLTNSVREGARIATFDQTEATIQGAVVARSAGIGLTTANVTVTCFSGATATTKTCGSVALGDGVRVAATHTFSPITGRLIAIVGASLNITSSAMRSVQ